MTGQRQKINWAQAAVILLTLAAPLSLAMIGIRERFGGLEAKLTPRVDCRPILEAADEMLELEGTTNEHLKLMLRKYRECSTPQAQSEENQ